MTAGFRLSKIVVAALIAAALPLAALAQSQPASTTPSLPDDVPTALAPPAADASARVLDDLFSQLKRARTERDAQRVSQQIWTQWFDSGDESINLLMGWAQRAVDEKNYPAAFDFLDQVIVLRPDFAEGWNRRATLHFLNNNHAKSMADIKRTLELEPRHFGALAGMAMILRRNGDLDLALKAYERALDVYPMDREVQKAVAELSELLADTRL